MAGVAAWHAVLLDVHVVALDEVVVVVHVVDVLVHDVRFKDSSRAWQRSPVVSRAAAAASRTITAARAKAIAAIAAATAVAAATAATAVAAATEATAGIVFGISLGVDLAHHLVITSAGRSVLDIRLSEDVLDLRRANFRPVIVQELFYEETSLVLLLVSQGRESFGELDPFELEPDVGRQHEFFHLSLARLEFALLVGRLDVLADVDGLRTKNRDASESKCVLHGLMSDSLI